MIRNATLDDAQALADIYNHYVRESTATFDTEEVSGAAMRERVVRIAARYPCLVYEDGGEVKGYCYAHVWKEKPAYARTAETTVYLAPSHTGRGIGEALMRHLIAACRSRGLGVLVACITAGNEASFRLHERLGFSRASYFAGVGRKFGQTLDVSDYVLSLDTPVPPIP